VLTLAQAPANLPSPPAFLKIAPAGENQIEITYNKDQSNAGEILSAVQAQGHTIMDVTTREADLEDVFVQLTTDTAGEPA
jgi:ABC-2 type transport system ATP-binding protein